MIALVALTYPGLSKVPLWKEARALLLSLGVSLPFWGGLGKQIGQGLALVCC